LNIIGVGYLDKFKEVKSCNDCKGCAARYNIPLCIDLNGGKAGNCEGVIFKRINISEQNKRVFLEEE